MSNYRRYYRAGGYYFFTVVTYQRRGILTSEVSRALLRQVWDEVKFERPFETVAVCLLPDHLHCIWELPENDSDYSTRWASIKARFTKSYLAKGGKEGLRNLSRKRSGEGAVWQRRFWEHRIRDQRDLQNHVDYIHYNPVKHQLVQRAEDWPYSTYKKYMSEYPLLSGCNENFTDIFVGE